MEYCATVTISEDSQITLPAKIRKKLRLKKDVQFLIYSDKDLIILKKLTQPSHTDFDDCINKMKKEIAKNKKKHTSER